MFKCAEVDRFRLKAQYTNLYPNHLATGSASDSANLSLEGFISSPFEIFDVFIENLIPANDDVYLVMRLGSSGSYTTSAYGYYNVHAGTSASDSFQTDGRAVASGDGWVISGQDEFSVGSESDEGFTGHVRLFNVRNTNFPTGGQVISGTYLSVDGYMGNPYISVLRLGNTTAHTDVQVFFSSGNIASGSIHLLGYYNS